MNYMDDVDLCRRLRERGWHVWYTPQAQAIHLMAAGPGGRSVLGPVRDLNRYFEMRRGPVACLALKAIEAVGFGIRAAVYLAAATLYRHPGWRAMAHTHWTAFKVALERTA
jgi:GT2 family glycosyltransferase